MYISRFHYLTQDIEGYTHAEQAKLACEYGVEWIQLRVKNKTQDEYLEIAKSVSEICQSTGTKLIINDAVEICKTINADGVHLGKTDMPVSEARMFLGKDKIIGGTANTFEDIVQLYAAGADYVGLGPYRFTQTKQNLSPVLGLSGYQQILQQMHAAHISIPIIAIGGIQASDITPLLKLGIHGIAVSSAVHFAADKNEALKKFMSVF